MTKQRTIVFWLCLLFYSAVTAQSTDSVRTLTEVVVEQSRLGDYAISRYSLRPDGATMDMARGGSLADLLRKNGFGGVRSYGPGGLASPSFRGTGSSHTNVLWNGINIVSPLVGQTDLSQLPVTFFDDASVQTGGSASLYGNGAIGATISLNNTAQFNEGLSVKSFSSIGSFGYRFQDASVQWSGNKFISSARVFTMFTENDFSFRNTGVSPARTDIRQHNAARQHGLLQQNYWQLAPQHLLWTKFWFQDNGYEVPNTIFSNRPGEATQQDRSYRSLLGYSWSGSQLDFTYQGALVHQSLKYQDPAISLTSSNRFYSLLQNAEVSTTVFRTGKVTSGLHYTWEKGIVDAFGGHEPERNRAALFAAYKQTHQWLTLSASLREELVNGNTTPIAPAATVEAAASKHITVFVSSARNYRLPTFNDLYWRGAGAQGNASLRPELGWSHELGLTYKADVHKPVQYSFKSVAFTNKVNDWILWLPMAGQTWSPQNIKQVWSRGVEAQGNIQTPWLGMVWELRGQYTFTRATNRQIYNNGNPNEAGKQLMYTPMHEGSITLCVKRSSYQLQATQAITGKQYTDTDNDDFFALQPFGITNLWISKAWQLKNFSATLNAEINNLFDTDYVSRPGYPMPGIHYRIGLTIQFNKPNIL